MIQFKKVKFKNFGSFGNTFTQIDLTKNSTTLICGSNGSGKSFAFLDSITYGLFGKPFRKINIPQLINSINNKGCMVEVEFTKGTDKYLVKRGLTPKVFEIYKNDTLINQDSKSLDYQAVLEEHILKMNYKTFTQVVILGSSSFVPFMQLAANDRRGVIENILDIDIFSTMNTVLKGKIMQLKEILRNLTTKIDIQKNKIEMQTAHVQTLVNKSNIQYTSMESEITELKDSIRSTTEEFNNITKEIDEINKTSQNRNQIKTTLEKTTLIYNKLTFNLNALEKEIHFLEENDNCPMCHQGIVEEFKKIELSDRQTKLHSLTSAISDLNLKLKDIKVQSTTLNDQWQKVITLQLLLGKKEVLIENYRKQLYILSNKKETKAEQDKDITAETHKLEEYTKDLIAFSTEKEKFHSDVVYNETVFTLLKDGGVKSKIVKYYLPHINAYINKFLTSMNFFAQFNLDENFNEEIKSRNRDIFSYENFSEGEKMRIDLSLLLAWREIARAKNSVNCNLLILDEVFDSSLDSVGMEELMKLINVVSDKSNIFIISHKSDQLMDKFQHIMTFEKKHNFSKLVAI